MEAESQAAEQIVRMTLAGSETLVRLTGAGAKQAAAALLAVAASHEKTKGRARLAALLKSGKELTVFALAPEQMRPFAREARRYGVLYTVVKERGSEGPVDLIVRAEDASKINRIIDRLGVATVREEGGPQAPDDPSPVAAPPEAAPEGPSLSRDEAAALLADLKGAGGGEREEGGEPPLAGGAEAAPPSAPTSERGSRSERDGSEGGRPERRPSVRGRIEEIRKARGEGGRDGGGEPRLPKAKTVPGRDKKGGAR